MTTLPLLVQFLAAWIATWMDPSHRLPRILDDVPRLASN